ncbi:hypothetical protein PF005_g13562 [Phytophthora fragariae]|uniref:RxLR effector protein n=1 Tax=Phytophthora fragariae TaxID=53985 RepID=A0A6A3ESE6_9STRA|nr:hypothetical protein PF003_g1859 [Phytophthora fragariae]KAE8935337.1 hypothetical protein PF009_g14719 [Phytophthora fragariae]KAE9105253.1 hypothetical protein PF007_g13772 [Phytophthora fragariae]KAE9110120.1 hypothetical protein PF006_g20524 [Phytophthora fragariae]KAE9205075.1 hypothetical protein PF005_g13562 [Phytophthora fragariae]
MRLLLWVLLVTLVTFVSSVNATSAITASKETTVSQFVDSDTDVLTAGNNDNSKRFLRSDTKNDLTTADDDSDDPNAERGGTVNPTAIFLNATRMYHIYSTYFYILEIFLCVGLDAIWVSSSFAPPISLRSWRARRR